MTATAWDLRLAVSRAEAARICRVSLDTIRRRLRDGAFPHAWQSGVDQHWSIPLQDLVEAGLLAPEVVEVVAQATDPIADETAPPSPLNSGQHAAQQLVEVLAENRGLRSELARAQDEIDFLRALVAGGRAA